MKRTRGSSLTGGTGDFNPQIYTITTLQSTADTEVTNGFPTPIPRFGTGGSTTSPVMEILKVYFILDDITAQSAQTAVIAALSTASLANIDPGGTGLPYLFDPRSFAFFSLDGIFSTAAGFALTSRIFEFNLTDGSGRGLLVATDNIFLNIFSTATGRQNAVTAKILYRLKNITLQEYVGIVQSQQ